MTYKETFYFVAKCLTISLEPENKKDIKYQLEIISINWGQVVRRRIDSLQKLSITIKACTAVCYRFLFGYYFSISF
jgi:hypothetical protein